MKIIISGVVDIDVAQMDKAMAGAEPLIVGALTQEGCMDYDWCPDPVNPGRIRVFERWESEESLANHFNNHWYRSIVLVLPSLSTTKPARLAQIFLLKNNGRNHSMKFNRRCLSG